MSVLIVNTGSTSVKLALYDDNCHPSKRIRIDAQPEPAAALQSFLDNAKPRAIAHRVVHGGRHNRPAVVDDALIAELERYTPLAPNHNPVAIAWMRACLQTFPDVPQTAVFDTAFFARLPEVAATYALPLALSEKYALRRYGFHGLAHASMWRAWQALGRGGQTKVISLQLGGGCSAAALHAGQPLDTSMGMTPLEGLVMSTRAGDVDPGLLLYLLQQGAASAAGLERILAEESGLLGVSDLSGDVRDLLTSDNPQARLAVDVYIHRARKYVGAYLAVLGGADAILIGGGAGERLPALRAGILQGLEYAGIVLDPEANACALSGTASIHSPESRVEIWVAAVDEEQIMLEAVQGLSAG